MSNKLKLIIVIGLFVILFIILTIVSIIKNNSNQGSGDGGNGSVNQNSYVDPASGETVLSPDGKVKEPDENSILLLGFSKLLGIGFSSQQLNNLNSFLNNYSHDKTVGVSEKITEISLVVDSITQNIDSGNSEITINSDIVVNRKYNEKITIKYHNTYDFTLTIFDSSGVVIGQYPSEG